MTVYLIKFSFLLSKSINKQFPLSITDEKKVYVER